MKNKWLLLAAPENEGGIVQIHQDAKLYAARIEVGNKLSFSFKKDYGWLQIARGNLRLGEYSLEAGDGLSFSGEKNFMLEADEEAEVLMFELS